MSDDRLHYLGHRKRLRERFLRGGFVGFADYEIVELVLTLAIPRCDVKRPAKTLLAKFGNLRGILDAPIEELQKIDGIGQVSPIALKIIREVANLYLQQTAEGQESFTNPEYLYQFWRLRIGALPNEVFEVGFLDAGYRLLQNGVERLEEGTVDRAVVYPRKVIEAALHHRAAALVLAHNHPNGDVQPTEQDRLLTRALVLAANTVQIKVFDHLIVSIDKVFSFRTEGLL